MQLTTLPPSWLLADLGQPRRVLSFAPYRPGFVTASTILWRQVRDADLTPDLNVDDWLAAEIRAIGQPDCVAMLTSRQLDRVMTTAAGPVSCAATVGLGNAERVGARRVPSAGRAGYGTINIAVLIESGLTDAAMIEAMTIIAQARTAAIIQAGIQVPAGPATGTGTDCIVLAADLGEARFAGLHTPLGEQLGRAVFQAVLAGAQVWQREQRAGSIS
ncbi:adenosylcobinamide amidohydrolase [Paracoccus sp. M683]|uniref:adenosylcobinamide amidohydrolase n=1 Tax=Paracoccus sp. M683 TaxID=2594268 RepID=UPI0011804BCB|nr:adenosylcobinamide amidohydrolase [Paracoccus sp. M683]TRW96011.1 adenosylcobinamide amidohydrolase [Paracoccus sp. M683]